MTTINTIIFDRLMGYAGLTSLVADRIYPNTAEQDPADPYVSFRKVSGPRDSCMGADSGIVRARYQFDIFATDFDKADEVATQVRGAIQRYRAAPIHDIFIVNELWLRDDITQEQHIVIDAEVDYSE